MRYILANMSPENLEEYFHDAVDYHAEALRLFSVGHLCLDDRAKAEYLFRLIECMCRDIIHRVDHPVAEIVDQVKRPRHQYLANFSVFQSLSDSWSLGHLFPAAPLSGFGQPTTIEAQLVDITCDSYGTVTAFAHPVDTLHSLPLHAQKPDDTKYFVGFFLTGAYQDNVTNYHNLLSTPHDVTVRFSDVARVAPRSIRIPFQDCFLDVTPGLCNAEVLDGLNYDRKSLRSSFSQQHAKREASLGKSWAEKHWNAYPYLRGPCVPIPNASNTKLKPNH